MPSAIEIETLRRRLSEVERERGEAWDRIRVLDGLTRSFATLAAAREVDEVIAAALRSIQEFLHFRRAVYFERCDDALVPRVIVDARFEGCETRSIPSIRFEGLLVTWVGEAVRVGQPHDLSSPLVDVRRWYVLAPVADDEVVYGFVFADDHPKAQPVGSESELFGIVGTVTAAALRSSRLYQQVRRLALHDSLTGLFNRRAIEERLAAAVEVARRTATTCAVALLDVDGLKLVNDKFGHAAGDLILRNIAGTMARLCRPEDDVGRFAGDEFIVLFRDCDENLARGLLRRLSGTLRKSGLRCSIGAAVFPRCGQDPNTLVEAADRALYAVKAAGRNGFAFA